MKRLHYSLVCVWMVLCVHQCSRMCVASVHVCVHPCPYSMPVLTFKPQVQLSRVYIEIIAFPRFVFHDINIFAHVCTFLSCRRQCPLTSVSRGVTHCKCKITMSDQFSSHQCVLDAFSPCVESSCMHSSIYCMFTCSHKNVCSKTNL